MQRFNTSLFIDIETDNDLMKFVDKSGLLILNIYSQWCGPCISLNNILYNIKMQAEENEELNLAYVNSDTVTQLERFNRTSEPIWMFVYDGKALNLMFGADSWEFTTMVMYELKYKDKLYTQRNTWDITEMQPVEIETQKLIAEVQMIQWKCEMDPYLQELQQVIDLYATSLPYVRVTLFGPHILQSFFNIIVGHAERMGVFLVDRSIVYLTRDDFHIINYSCLNPMSDDVLEEFYDNFVLICVWRMPDTCRTVDEINAMMNEVVDKFRSPTISHLPPSANINSNDFQTLMNIVVRRNPKKYLYYGKQKYSNYFEKYGHRINNFIKTIPNMAANEYNQHRLIDVIVRALYYNDPDICLYPYTFNAHTQSASGKEQSSFVTMRQRRDELFNRLYKKNFDTRSMAYSMSKDSELFGDEGLDEDLEYLLEELSAETESSQTHEDTYAMPLEIPAVWIPDNIQACACIIYLYFPLLMEQFQLIVQPKTPKSVIMAFRADSIDTKFAPTLARYGTDILDYGFFTSDKADEAQFITRDFGNYYKVKQKLNSDKLVMCVKYENSKTALNLVRFGPTHISPHEVYGDLDAAKFFNSITNENTDVHDLLRKQRIFYNSLSQLLEKNKKALESNGNVSPKFPKLIKPITYGFLAKRMRIQTGTWKAYSPYKVYGDARKSASSIISNTVYKHHRLHTTHSAPHLSPSVVNIAVDKSKPKIGVQEMPTGEDVIELHKNLSIVEDNQEDLLEKAESSRETLLDQSESLISWRSTEITPRLSREYSIESRSEMVKLSKTSYQSLTPVKAKNSRTSLKVKNSRTSLKTKNSRASVESKKSRTSFKTKNSRASAESKKSRTSAKSKNSRTLVRRQ